MAAKTNKTGTLIKEARTGAGLTQEKLAASIKGVSAQDISKAERGELMLTQETLKQIAKLTGVTQTSLINAAKEDTKPAAKKTEAKPAAKTTTAKTTAKKTETKPAAKSTAAKTTAKKTETKPAAKTTAAKTSTKTAATKTTAKTTAAKKADTKPKTPANANTSMKVTATEKKMVELYRAADSDTKKKVISLLKGEEPDVLSGLVENGLGELLGGLLGGNK